MQKGLDMYKEFIDHITSMAQNCVDSKKIENGFFPEVDYKDINIVLSKLTVEDRIILSKIVLDSYSTGIYDVLDYLEWLKCCKEMKITILGETLLTNEFEGFSCDFVGRKSGNWS